MWAFVPSYTSLLPLSLARNKGTAIGLIWNKSGLCVFSVEDISGALHRGLADSLSSNLSDLEEDYYLLLCAPFPTSFKMCSVMTRVCVKESERCQDHKRRKEETKMEDKLDNKKK